MVDFLVVKVQSTYNDILERPSLRMSQTMIFIYHRIVKFPTDQGMGELSGDQSTTKKYYFNNLKDQSKTQQTFTVIVSKVQPQEEDKKSKAKV